MTVPRRMLLIRILNHGVDDLLCYQWRSSCSCYDLFCSFKKKKQKPFFVTLIQRFMHQSFCITFSDCSATISLSKQGYSESVFMFFFYGVSHAASAAHCCTTFGDLFWAYHALLGFGLRLPWARLRSAVSLWWGC